MPGAPFAELLRGLRQAANLTQEELAETSGLSVQAISMLERGVRRVPRTSTVEYLARALGLGSDQRAAFVLAAAGRTANPHPSTPRQIEDTLARHQATTAVRDSGTATVDAQADPVIPRQIPAPVQHFVGRVAELATLSDLADQAIGTAVARR